MSLHPISLPLLSNSLQALRSVFPLINRNTIYEIEKKTKHWVGSTPFIAQANNMKANLEI